MFYNQGLNLVN